jgi:hypothetical protein
VGTAVTTFLAEITPGLPDWIIAGRARIWFHSSFGRSWRQVRRLMSGGNVRLSGSATKQEYYHVFLCNNSQDKTIASIGIL